MTPSPHFSWLSIIRRANKTKILYPRDLRTFSPCCDWRSRDSSVGIKIRLWDRLHRNRGSIPCRDKIFVSSQERPNQLWGWLIPPFVGYWNLSTAGGGKLTSHLCRMLRLQSPHPYGITESIFLQMCLFKMSDLQILMEYTFHVVLFLCHL
jgi:hypothetical protein